MLSLIGGIAGIVVRHRRRPARQNTRHHRDAALVPAVARPGQRQPAAARRRAWRRRDAAAVCHRGRADRWRALRTCSGGVDVAHQLRRDDRCRQLRWIRQRPAFSRPLAQRAGRRPDRDRDDAAGWRRAARPHVRETARRQPSIRRHERAHLHADGPTADGRRTTTVDHRTGARSPAQRSARAPTGSTNIAPFLALAERGDLLSRPGATREAMLEDPLRPQLRIVSHELSADTRCPPRCRAVVRRRRQRGATAGVRCQPCAGAALLRRQFSDRHPGARLPIAGVRRRRGRSLA